MEYRKGPIVSQGNCCLQLKNIPPYRTIALNYNYVTTYSTDRYFLR